MTEKSKLARRSKVAVAIRPPQQPNIATNPLDVIADRRRNFYTHLLEQIQSLPDGMPILPEHLQDEIRTYSRIQNSEKGIMTFIECTIEELKEILPFLLQIPHLRSVQLLSIIRSFLSALRLRQENVAVEDDMDLEYNQMIYRRLQRYVRSHLSIFIHNLPADMEKTDVSVEQLKVDLSQLHPTEDLFHDLFISDIPLEIIKNFLATSTFQNPAGDYNIRWTIQSFLRQHQFDLIKTILEETPVVTDWKSVLPAHYYDKYPSGLWKLKTWDEFETVLRHILKYSIDISEYLNLFKKKTNPLRLIGGDGVAQEKNGSAPTTLAQPVKLLKIRNRHEEELIMRYRPDIPNVAAVLIKPVAQSDCSSYLGKAIREYYYPTDAFFHDLVQYHHDQPRDILHLTIDSYDPPLVLKIRINFLLSDGRIVPQTASDYKRLIRYLEDTYPIKSRIHEFLLGCELSYLAADDLNCIRDRIKKDLSTFLTLLYTDKMDTDKIATIIEENLLSESVHLEDYLSHAFDFFVQIHPRYELYSIFPEIKERFDFFFYRIDRLMPPVEIWCPRIILFSETQRQKFTDWLSRSRKNFIQEYLFLLLNQNYSFLRVKMVFDPIRSQIPDSCASVTTDLKLALLLSHKGQWVELHRLAYAILHQEEYMDIPDTVLRLVENHFDLDRLYKGFSATLFDTGFELLDEHEDVIVEKNDFILPIVPPIYQSQELPDFKLRAFELLARLQAAN